MPRSPDSLLDSEIELRRNLIPACERCKRLRRKCDTLVPFCALCEKAGAECEFYDHTSEQILPRGYIEALLNHWKELKRERTHVSPCLEDQPNNMTQAGPSPNPNDSQNNFDHHFLLPNTPSRTEFFGSSSAFSLAVEVLTYAYHNPLFDDSLSSLDGSTGSDTSSAANNYTVRMPSSTRMLHDIGRETVESLLSIYRASLNTIYPFFLDSAMAADLSAYLRIVDRTGFDSTQLNGDEAFQYFRINMMCAITCATKSRYHQSLVGLEESFYQEALKYIEEVTSEVSSKSLQVLLLLIQYCLFHPQKGDIWKLLDFACRLSVELGYHTERDKTDINEEEKELRRGTFWGLYAIERIVGQLFGRPSDLPESIITTEYPSNASRVPQDHTSAQVIFSAHHYRLVYLRSEIYREIYLPAQMPDRPSEWFKERYSLLSQWWKDTVVDGDPGTRYTGVGQVTCMVAYHSTIIFLLQPLMLRALSSSSHDVEFIPWDNYRSAVQLIKTYRGVLQAPDDSALGIYPMTFMSAHYICLAALTILAHGILSLDECTETYWLLEESESTIIDYDSIHEVSSSCLILLAWCAERWPGMEGMLNMFTKLSEKLLPEVSRRKEMG